MKKPKKCFIKSIKLDGSNLKTLLQLLSSANHLNTLDEDNKRFFDAIGSLLFWLRNHETSEQRLLVSKNLSSNTNRICRNRLWNISKQFSNGPNLQLIMFFNFVLAEKFMIHCNTKIKQI